MELDRWALRLVHVLLGASTIAAVTLPPSTNETIDTETIVSEFTTDTNETEKLPEVPLMEQVMDLNISVTELPDVDPEAIDAPDIDKNRVIRDIAYYIRAHKFREFDRRYYRSADKAPTKLYEDFPKPNLRSLHWEVRKHCAASFIECLKYIERKIRLTELRREDDTVTIMLQQNWKLPENTEQILTAQNDCQNALKRDDLTAAPFQGPIERFQWRTTVSYYMCWYTMLGVPDLASFDDFCDNHANCLDEYNTHNKDPRADDTKPFACALYSFCPDHCCPMKHIWYMKDCFQSQQNPCYADNPPAYRKCTLNREENQDLEALRRNWINVSCECRQPGYEWSSRFGQCVDVNECTRGTHNCTLDVESCMNLPGHHACICRLGNVYDAKEERCVHSAKIEKILQGDIEKPKITEKVLSLFEKIARIITRSAASGIGLSPILIASMTRGIIAF